MTLSITARALKDLKAMPAKDSTAILRKLEAFAANRSGDVKKLAGGNLYRLRHGEWRAIFEIADGVIVLRVLNRREAYR